MLKQGDITLRTLHIADQAILASLANNKKVWDNLRDYVPHPYTVNDAAFFIGLTNQEDPKVTFGITYQEALCGVIGLVPQKDIYRKTAEIGYWIGETYWGKGIATTAVKLMTTYGFAQLHFARIHAGIIAYNSASMKVLAKNGYERDGIFKKSIIKNEKLWDEYRYAKTNDQIPY